MSNDSGRNAPTGNSNVILVPENAPNATLRRRLSVYWTSGEGHTFELEPEDQLIDPLIRPEGAGEDWQPDPMDVARPRLIIERYCPLEGHMNRESISLDGAAWWRYQQFWIAPAPEKPKTNLVPANSGRPPVRFRDERRPSSSGSTSVPVSKDPVKLPPEN